MIALAAAASGTPAIEVGSGTAMLSDGDDMEPRSVAPGRPERTGAAYYRVELRSRQAVRCLRRDAARHDWPAAAEIVDALGADMLAVRMRRDLADAVRSHPLVEDVAPYGSALKLSPHLRTVAGAHSPGSGRLAVSLFRDESVGDVTRRLAAHGLPVTGHVSRRHRTTLMVEGAAAFGLLEEIAAWEAVRFIEPVLVYRTMNSSTDQVLQAGGVGSGTPYWSAGIRGAGQSVSVMDSGLDVDTVWFSHTETDAGVPGSGHRKVLSYEAWGGGTVGTCACVNISILPGQPFSFSHGTLVTANILGNRQDFGLSDVVEGMAPGARVHFQDIGDSSGLFSTCDFGTLYPPDDLLPALEDAFARGARVHNNSWGTARGDTYSMSAADVDAFLWTHPDSVVLFAAGDCGPDGGANCSSPGFASIGAPGTAKNDITVGGSDQDPAQSDVDPGSSRGPETVGSGRVGPTIVMVDRDPLRAHDIASVHGAQDLGPSCAFASGDCDISGPLGESCIVFGISGTSYATAYTAGAVLLIRDYLAQGFAPDGVADAGDALPDPSGPLVKAVLLNSAAFMTGTGAGTHRFNNDQGYGRVQLTNALPLDGVASTPSGLVTWDRVREEGLGVSELARDHRFEVLDASREVRVTLAYYDPPSPVGSSGDLINDLSLVVRDPAGNLFRGNHFTGAFTPPNGGSEDSTNPTEMVVVRPADLVPGIYVATVSVGAGGVVEGHPNHGGQPYALVASGDVVARDAPGLGSVPGGAGNPGSPLRMAHQGGQVALQWSASCLPLDYVVYRGTIAELAASSTSEAAVLMATTGGSTMATDAGTGGSYYYIVVPHDGLFEGSYGMDGDLSPRPRSVHSPFLASTAPCGS